MVIGIDISQLAYENTGVANYLKNLVENLIKSDNENKYILFYSSMRKDFRPSMLDLEATKNKELPSNIQLRQFRIPPTVLDILWNRLHILPIEKLIGNVDIFITSDWTEPPVTHAKKATIIYDLIVYKHPNETARKIIDTQKRRLKWVRKETDKIFCISKSTAHDVSQIFNISKDKIEVIYPGVSLDTSS